MFRCSQDLLAIPSVAEMHEVWDFLSENSQVLTLQTVLRLAFASSDVVTIGSYSRLFFVKFLFLPVTVLFANLKVCDLKCRLSVCQK